MSYWVWIAIVIEAMAVLSWAAASLSGQMKFAFLFGFNVMLPIAFIHLVADGAISWRAALALVSVIFYLINMNVVILLWTSDTAMSKLDGYLSRPKRLALSFLMTNVAGWVYCLPLYFIGRLTGPPGWTASIALALYAGGTAIHFCADLQKRRFKADPAMRGRLLDRGSWRYSRHPNYFGDFLVYVSWVLLAANSWAWISPAVNLAQYAFDAIPKNENWAAKRYGPAWFDYVARTSRFIPWPAFFD